MFDAASIPDFCSFVLIASSIDVVANVEGIPLKQIINLYRTSIC